jgi:hypothetical protein
MTSATLPLAVSKREEGFKERRLSNRIGGDFDEVDHHKKITVQLGTLYSY